MLRVESENGWWLITHPDHAHLAADFAAHWGNAQFAPPQPRANVLHGIYVHDDGWAARDAHPTITRQGKPAAFSHELVGKYSAFEEIDLAAYLAVRENALDQVEARDPYAALLVSLHTHNLLTERADRSTIAPDQLPLLDTFLERQVARQDNLRSQLRMARRFADTEVADTAILNNFRLLQAMDNLSLYSCVGFDRPGTLLHPLLTTEGGTVTVDLIPIAPRSFRLTPYPMDEPALTFELPARHVHGKYFSSTAELAALFHEAPIESLAISLYE